MTQSILPPASLLSLPVQGVGAFGGAGGATSVPPAIAALPAGTLISGIITGRSPQGHLVLQTDRGDLVLHTAIFFKRGMELTLRIDKARDETVARILTVDGTALAKYVEAASGEPPEPDVILQSTLQDHETPALPLPPKTLPAALPAAAQPRHTSAAPPFPHLTAILLTPLPADAEMPNPLPPPVARMLQGAPVGTQLILRIVQLTPPDATPSSSPPLSPSPPSFFLPAPAVSAPNIPVIIPSSPIAPSTSATGDTSGGTPLAPAAPASAPAATAAASIPPTTAAPAAVPSSPVATIIAAASPAEAAPLPPVSNAPPPQVIVAAATTPHISPVSSANAALAAPAPVSTPAPSSALATAAPVPSSPFLPPPPTPTPAAPRTEASLPSPLSPPSLPPSPTPAPAVLTATVLESSAAGLTLHSPLGTLRLLSPVPLRPGTQLRFEIAQTLPSAPPAASGRNAAALLSALEELRDVPLPAAFPANAADLYHPRLIPKLGPELASEMLFLMSALKGGDVRKWLGEETVRRLEERKGEALKRIAAEFSGMKHSVGEAGDPQRWTLYQLPLATGVGMEPLRFYHRESDPGEEREEEKRRGESGDHFILDVTFSHIGTLQLDGFVRHSPLHFSFELIIRSEHRLEEELKQGIRAIYREAGLIAGFEGAVNFQEGREALFRLPEVTNTAQSHGSGQSIVV